MNEEIRHALERLIKERRESYAGLSQLLGRNPAYIQQFVKRGSPRQLEQKDRQTLARYFQIDESILGGPPGVDPDPTVEVPRLSVQASAGSGSLVEGEFVIGSYKFDKAWLRVICKAEPKDLSIIKVTGDSMSPTLSDGDDLLVNQSDTVSRLRDGIYILRRDDTLMVKRLSLAPVASTLTISSDNPAYPTFRDCLLESVSVLGRVVWVGRTLG